jgi:hypothetical protein
MEPVVEEKNVENEELEEDHGSSSSESSSLSESLPEAVRKDTNTIVWGNIEFMKTISKSPYEPPNVSAEVGEAAFDDLKKLLVSPENNDEGVHSQAARLFGNRLAESLVTAFFQIGKSGMLFSPAWIEGKIRGFQCGWIPKALLLLCLHEQRLVRGSVATLQGVIKDLGCTKIVLDAIREWKLDREFINLSCNTNFYYMRNKINCSRCEIFVARAFRTIKALKRQRIETNLWKKITDCLKIMNETVRVTNDSVAKRLAAIDEAENPPKVGAKKAPPAAAAKRKGRNESGDKESKRRRKERQDSIDVLVGMFEEHSKRMQEILGVIKRKLREEKEEMTEEIRREVRQELLKEQSRKNGKKKKT